MLKVYEWLVYIFMRPHKSFQHLIKWFGVFLSEPKQIQKKKGKIKQKRNQKNLTCRPGGVGPGSPPGPPGAGGSSSTSRAPKLLGGMPPSQPGTTRRRRRASRPPRALSSHLDAPGDSASSFPPSRASSSSPSLSSAKNRAPPSP